MECLAGSHTSPEWGDFPPWSFGLPSGLHRGWGQAGTAGITLPHRGGSLSEMEGAERALPGSGEKERNTTQKSSEFLKEAMPDLSDLN